MPLDLNPEVYRAILESLPNGIYVVDRDRRILLWSSSAERITGYLRQEVIGRFCKDNLLMHCDERHTILCGEGCPLRQTMQDGKPAEAEVYLRHKNGERVPVRVRASPVRDASAAIVGAVEDFEERPGIKAGAVDRKDSWNGMDEITGIPGHDAVRERLEMAVSGLTERGTPFGLLMFAIEGLDQFQHQHGKNASEAIERAVAQTLARNLHPDDLLGHWAETGSSRY